MGKISLVLPVYNEQVVLKEVLEKYILDLQNIRTKKQYQWEIIAVDDCSTDDTRAWLKEQQARNTNLYVIENEINIRQGGGRNKGVRAAKGEYIAFIDCDDYFHKDSLAKVYHYIKCKNLDILISDSAYQFKGYEHNNLQLNFKYTEETNAKVNYACIFCKNEDEFNNLVANFDKTILAGNIADGRKLVLKLEEYKSMIENSAKTRQVYTICRYVQELASEFHSFYNAVRVISDNKELTKARVALVCAVKTVLNNALDLLAVSAPERM